MIFQSNLNNPKTFRNRGGRCLLVINFRETVRRKIGSVHWSHKECTRQVDIRHNCLSECPFYSIFVLKLLLLIYFKVHIITMYIIYYCFNCPTSVSFIPGMGTIETVSQAQNYLINESL